MTSVDKWKVIKYIAFAVIFLMAVVLIIQFINLAKLQNESNALNSSIKQMEQELQDKTDYKNSLENNPSYIEDTAKGKFNMKYKDEDVLVGQN